LNYLIQSYFLYKKHTKSFKRRIHLEEFLLRDFLVKQTFLPKKKINCILNSRIIFSRRILFFFKKKFKKLFFKKNIHFRLNILPNYNISYKGKNPRMGRGGGFYSRTTVIHKPFRIFFSASNVSLNKSKKIVYFLKKKIQFTHFNF